MDRDRRINLGAVQTLDAALILWNFLVFTVELWNIADLLFTWVFSTYIIRKFCQNSEIKFFISYICNLNKFLKESFFSEGISQMEEGTKRKRISRHPDVLAIFISEVYQVENLQ